MENIKKCVTDLDDCKCGICQQIKQRTIEFGRKSKANILSTFGPTKFGVPSGKKIIPRPITDREPFKITDENWFFVTGTLLEKRYLHNDRCGANCKCDKERCEKC